MKQLFWKEWHELRLLPFAAAVCMVVLLVGSTVCAKLYGDIHSISMDDIHPLFVATLGIFALAAGASLFAQEVGSGSLVLLSTLPISRKRIWWVKVAAATCALLLSLLAVTLALVLPLKILLPGLTTAPLWNPLFGHQIEIVNALILVDIFAVALAVSPFFDRPYSAMIAAGLCAGVVYAAVGVMMNAYLIHHSAQYLDTVAAHRILIPPSHNMDHLMAITAALPLPVLLAISYWTFTRGESLRSAKRFRVGGLAGLASIAAAIVIFGIGYGLQWW